MVELTLTRMAAGGIHDQLGGGFCRYSVDERWEIPHFEKMLYDNAQLLPLLARVARTEHAVVIGGMVAWLQREMTAPDGAFFSAIDADSEHEEGKFYVWQRAEVRSLLSDDEFAVVDPYYGFDRAPNFEHVAWNPIVATALEIVARSLGIAADEANSRLAGARAKLFAARSHRVRPGLDDKILTSWNALMIAGLARASRASQSSTDARAARANQSSTGARSARLLDDPALMRLADRALDFLHQSAWRNDRLYASAGATLPAYLDDYAFLLDALIESLQCRWNDRDLAWAIALADALLQRFQDNERGGFFFTAHDHETLIQRPKPWPDDAVPSGNGVAARALLRLGHLLGEARYLDAAERTLHAAYSTMQQIPHACPSLLRALNDFLHPRTQVVIRAAAGAENTAWESAVRAIGPNDADVYLIPPNAAALPGIVSPQVHRAGGVAYVCRGVSCLPPMTEPASLTAVLNEVER